LPLARERAGSESGEIASWIEAIDAPTFAAP
jgi:hypothetical protein